MKTTCDRIAGHWELFQLADGHRFSTDDQVCAWHGAQRRPHADRLLDLGSGIGSVGLSALHMSGDSASLTAIEAQDISVQLFRKTLAHNGLEQRVRSLHGDIRDSTLLVECDFDLVTGSPPYTPLGRGVVSPHPQRAACRMELRGSVVAYCEAAGRWMSPAGGFCFVMAASDTRSEPAITAAGLRLVERIDYVFRQGKAPTIATFFCVHARAPDEPRPPRTITVRDAQGQFTPEYEAIRECTAPR